MKELFQKKVTMSTDDSNKRGDAPAAGLFAKLTELHNKKAKKLGGKLEKHRAELEAFETRVKALNAEPVPFEQSILYHLERNKLVGNQEWFDADDWVLSTALETRQWSTLAGVDGAKFLRHILPESIQNGDADTINEALWLICANIRCSQWALGLLDAIPIELKERAKKCEAARHSHCKCRCEGCQNCDGFDGEHLDEDGEDILEASAHTLVCILGSSDEAERFLEQEQSAKKVAK